MLATLLMFIVALIAHPFPLRAAGASWDPAQLLSDCRYYDKMVESLEKRGQTRKGGDSLGHLQEGSHWNFSVTIRITGRSLVMTSGGAYRVWVTTARVGRLVKSMKSYSRLQYLIHLFRRIARMSETDPTEPYKASKRQPVSPHGPAAWARNLLAGFMAGGISTLVGLVVFGYQVGSYTTETKLGQNQLQQKVEELAQETKAQVNNVADQTKRQLDALESRLTDKIKDSNVNVGQVADANRTAVAALSTLTTTVAANAERNNAQDREIDDMKRTLRDLNQTLRDLNNALRFVPSTSIPNPRTPPQ